MNKRGLYLTIRSIATPSGVTKKIEYQLSAFKAHGYSMDIVSLEGRNIHFNREFLKAFEYRGAWHRLHRFFPRPFQRKFQLSYLEKYINWASYEIVYIRYGMSTQGFIKALAMIKAVNPEIKILLELPSYPYAGEKKGLSGKIELWVDFFWRRYLKRYVDYIVLTSSKLERLFGIPTIFMPNAIEPNAIPIGPSHSPSKSLHLIAVANLSPWHGYDRLIKGMAEYYQQADLQVEVNFHIVGEGQSKESLERLSVQLELDRYVFFYGKKFGEELDELFQKAQIAISSLGHYRIQMPFHTCLKSREYTARGIPFIYSGYDPDFGDHTPFTLYFPGDSSVIDVQQIINFYKRLKKVHPDYRREMRAYAENSLSWEHAIKSLIEKLETV